MNERFIGRVVDVNDPEQAGRVKIRIFGKQDDEAGIPDSELPWARCIYPVTNPVSQGVAGPTTGMVVGTIVIGHFADRAEQIPLVEGTLGAVRDDSSDFPKSNRGEDHNEVLKDSIFHIGSAELKFLESKTIGSISYVGQDIKDTLQTIKEGSLVDGLRKAKGSLSLVKQLKTMMTNSPLSQLHSVLDGFKSDLKQYAQDQITDVLTDQLGNVINPGTIDNVIGGGIGSAIGGVLNGNTFNDATSQIATIGKNLAIGKIGGPLDALNRIGGNKFVMSGPMKGINSSLNSLKSNAKVKKLTSEFNQAKSFVSEAKSTINEVKSVI